MQVCAIRGRCNSLGFQVHQRSVNFDFEIAAVTAFRAIGFNLCMPVSFLSNSVADDTTSRSHSCNIGRIFRYLRICVCDFTLKSL